MITDLDDNSFKLLPMEVNPEASYNVPEIRYDKNTEITGLGSRLSDLANNAEVKVWVENKLANKIEIINWPDQEK